jgi:DNA end-binding protein Ku
MARAIWSGAISFGLVNIPVKLYSAVQRKTVRFHQLDQTDHQRIQQRRVNPRTGEEVPYENLVKGYEVSPERYVVITPEELESLEPEKTRAIDIEDFVDLDQIDPIFYDHPYYLVPDTGATKAYRLLLDAMKESGKVAVARVVLRSKEHLVAIRPRDEVLTMETMLFADEVVSPDQLDEAVADGKAKASKKELQMAQQLIDSLAGDFEPDKYRDEYRERVLEMIERKAEGEEIVLEAPAEAPKEVPDLMAALEQSIAGAKGQGGGKRAKPKRRTRAGGDGDGKPAASRKKTAKK